MEEVERNRNALSTGQEKKKVRLRELTYREKEEKHEERSWRGEAAQVCEIEDARGWGGVGGEYNDNTKSGW